MATLRTMNRRRRRVIEPGHLIEVFEGEGDQLCSYYERHQGRHVRRYALRGQPDRVCVDVPVITPEEHERLLADFEAIKWD